MPQMQDDRNEKTTTRSRRGFAAMDPERRREIARRGGASVPSEKRSFAQDRDLAASAGRKGGSASRGGGRRSPGQNS
jgi:general stress protein YciG